MVGCWCLDWYVYLSELGQGIAVHMQEGMENWIQLIKSITTDHIKANGEWVKRIADYVDIYVIGGISEEIVDLSKVRKHLMNDKQLLWEDGFTDDIIANLRKALPDGMQSVLDDLDKVKFGDTESIPANLYSIKYADYATAEQNRKLEEIGNQLDEHVRQSIIDARCEEDVNNRK